MTTDTEKLKCAHAELGKAINSMAFAPPEDQTVHIKRAAAALNSARDALNLSRITYFTEVLKFWQIGHPTKVRKTPGFPDDATAELNMKLIEEELEELKAGVAARDLVEVADALADLVYVVLGMTVTHGIPFDEVFAEVQKTNMAKFPGGKVVRRPSDSKIMKPPGWKPPDIKSIIDEANAD